MIIYPVIIYPVIQVSKDQVNGRINDIINKGASTVKINKLPQSNSLTAKFTSPKGEAEEGREFLNDNRCHIMRLKNANICRLHLSTADLIRYLYCNR